MKKLIVILLCFCCFGCDAKSEIKDNVKEEVEKEIKLDLLGDEEITLNYNEEFTDPGYKAFNNDEDVSNLVTVKGQVLNKPGEYTLTYELNLDDEVITKERKVIVRCVK